MRAMISFIGLLTLLAGILPFLKNFKILPNIIPAAGIFYYLIIIAIGIIGIIYGIMNPTGMLFGVQQFMVVFIGLLTLAGGVLPLISKYVAFIPAAFLSGIIYSVIIILIGIIGIIYGITQF